MRNLVLACAALILVCTSVRAESGPPDGEPASPRVEGKDANRVRTAMENIRQIAIAIESFAVDNNRYPRPDRTTDSVGPYRLGPVASIQRALASGGKDLPVVDPWGNPYLYWSSGQDYVLVCQGSDGTLTDRALVQMVIHWEAGSEGHGVDNLGPLPPLKCSAQDIICGDGLFLRYPKGPLGDCR